VFTECAKKNWEEINLNMTPEGLKNFHPVKGMYDANTNSYPLVNRKKTMTKREFLEVIPAADYITEEELIKKYGDKIKGSHIVKAMATRKQEGLSALGCHGFWRFYIRLNDGRYKVCDVGVYNHRFQKEISGIWGKIIKALRLDGVALFCATEQSVLSLQDQSGALTSRQTGGVPFFYDNNCWEKFTDFLYNRWQNGDVFQLSGKNCSLPIQESIAHTMGENHPNLYSMRVIDVKSGFRYLDNILAFLQRRSLAIQRFGLGILHGLLGSGRGMWVTQKDGTKKWHSVKQYFKDNDMLCNPTFLLEQIQNGKLSGGELTWGNIDSRLLFA
jgi:hypothetical protein